MSSPCAPPEGTFQCATSQFGQPGDKDHRGLADREEQPLAGGIGHAPARPPGKVDRVAQAAVEAQRVKRGTVAFVADAGCDRQTLPCNDRDAIRSRAGLESGPRFKAVGIDPSHACGAAVGYQDMPVFGDDAGGFREIPATSRYGDLV